MMNHDTRKKKLLPPLSGSFILKLCLFLGALSVPLFTKNQLLLNILVNCFFYSYLALCWNLVGGYAGEVSLAHGIFFGIGAYSCAALFAYHGLTPWLGMLCGGILAAAVAFALGRLTFGFGIKGFFFIVVGLAITQIFSELAKQMGFLGATEGLPLPVRMGWLSFQFRSKGYYYVIILVMLLAIVIISRLIERSRMGYNLVAVREDEDTAEASGIDSTRTKNLILTLSAFLTALGGAFYVQFVFFIDPDSAFSTSLNINLILAVVIGGIGTVWGPILGGFFFILVSDSLRFLPMQSQAAAALAKMVFAVVLMYVMIYCPAGILNVNLFKGVQRVKKKFFPDVAEKFDPPGRSVGGSQ